MGKERRKKQSRSEKRWWEHYGQRRRRPFPRGTAASRVPTTAQKKTTKIRSSSEENPEPKHTVPLNSLIEGKMCNL